MARKANVPDALTGRLVSLSEAREHGLGNWRLRTKSWTRVGPGIYLPSGVAITPALRIAAASKRLPAGAAFSGFSAAWLHGLDVEPCDPIEITIPTPARLAVRAGMKLRRRAMDPGDVVEVRGHRATSVVRTLQDLCKRAPITDAIVLLDQALHRRVVALHRLRDSGRFTDFLEHVEPKAESPMETRMRMRVVLGGLPRPEAQVPIYDSRGRFVGRPDLYYREQRLGLEYDGATHKTSLAKDNRRQNALLEAGVRLLRFTAADVLSTPQELVRLVSRELGIISRVR